MYTHIYMCICVCVCIYIYIYIYIYSPSPLPKASESDPLESRRSGGRRRGAASRRPRAQLLFHAVYCVNRSQA